MAEKTEQTQTTEQPTTEQVTGYPTPEVVPPLSGTGMMGDGAGDQDAQALNDAIDQVAAEENAAANAAKKIEDDQAAADQAAKDAEALPDGSLPAEEAGHPQGNIPKKRFDEVNQRRKESDEARIRAETENAMLKRLAKGGALTPEAIAALEGNDTTEVAETPTKRVITTAAETIESLNNAVLDLAQKLEDGEIGMVEYKKGEMEFNRRIDAVKADVSQAKNQDTISEVVSQATRIIEKDFEVLRDGLVTQEQMDDLIPVARRAAELSLKTTEPGATFNPKTNPRHLTLLQWHVANTCDKVYGQGLGPISQRKAPASAPVVEAPVVTPTKQPVIAARTTPAAKVLLAASQPPNLNGFHGNGSEGGLTDANIMSMSTEDMAKLPPGTLEALAMGT